MTKRISRVIVGFGLATALCVVAPSPLAGQLFEAPHGPGPSLHPSHWSYHLLDAVDALGWTADSHAEGWVDTKRPAGTAVVARVLREAAAEIPAAGHPRGGELLRTWAGAFAAERPGPLSVEASTGIREGDGLFLPGRGAFGFVGARADVGTLTGWVRYGGGDVRGLPRLRQAGVAARVGSFDVRVGRQTFQLGPGLADPFMGGRVPIDAVAVQSSQAHTLPGFLSALGPVTVQGVLGTLEETGQVTNALFGASNLTLEPFGGVRLGLWRIARFGGDGLPDTSLRRLFNVAIGKHNRPDFEDQMAAFSAEVRWAPRGQALSSYGFVGFKDSAGAYYRDPAVVVGTLAPIPNRRGLTTVRYEHAAMGERGQAVVCAWCEYDSRGWYTHQSFRQWTVNGLPMGHTLGGYGAQHTVRAEHWFAGTPLRLHLQADHVTREDRNLQEERWPGIRRRVEIGTHLNTSRGLSLTAAGEVARNRAAGTEVGLAIEARYVVGLGGGRLGGRRGRWCSGQGSPAPAVPEAVASSVIRGKNRHRGSRGRRLAFPRRLLMEIRQPTSAGGRAGWISGDNRWKSVNRRCGAPEWRLFRRAALG